MKDVVTAEPLVHDAEHPAAARAEAPRKLMGMDRCFAFPKLTPAQIDIFRSVIHPEVVIRAARPISPCSTCARSVLWRFFLIGLPAYFFSSARWFSNPTRSRERAALSGDCS